jgi:hypothetical protein
MTSMLAMGLQTEYEFTLPMGYVDGAGNLHRQGVMRLATAADEILPLKDPRVQSNPAYLIVILLSRVISNLGTINSVNPGVVEGLFAGDLAYLQDFYNQINLNGNRIVQVNCPHCQQGFEVELDRSGES